MKRIKLLLSTLVMMLLVTVMTFSVVACTGGNGGSDGKTAGDLGITDSSKNENLALQSIGLSGSYAREFAFGTPFSAEGLIVTATYIDYSISEAYTEIKTLNSGEYVIDSSEYNSGKVGTYTIYVSHTHTGVTVTSSYEVTVTPTDVAYGGIVATLKEDVTTEYRLTSETKSVKIEKSDVNVYEVQTDGTLSTTPLAESDYTAELYLGSEKVEDNTAVKNGVYTLVVSLNSNPAYKDFVNYYIANALTGIELATSTDNAEIFTQSAHPANSLVNKWEFTLTYENGHTETVKGSQVVATQDSEGNRIEGLHITMDTMTVSDAHTTTVVYDETDALGEYVSKECTVAYKITANVVPLEFGIEYFAESGQSYSDGSVIAKDITGSLGLYTVGTLSAGNGSMTYTDGRKGTVRLQFGSNNNYFRLESPGMAVVTMWYWCGTTGADEVGIALYKDSINNDPVASVYCGKVSGQVAPATFIVPEAGTYYLRRLDGVSANITGITVQSVIPAHGDTIEPYTLTFNENYTGGATREQQVIGFTSETMNLATVAGYTPVRAGYTFEGWYTAAEGGELVAFPYTVKADATVYAHWTENDVEAIAAEKTKTEYVLTNRDVTINDWSDITVTNATGSALSSSWTYAYKLFSDEDCKNEVANGTVFAIGTYYIQVAATKGEKTLYATVRVTVVDPTSMTVAPATVTKTVPAGQTLALNVADLNLLLKSNSGDQLIAESGSWEFTYVLTDADEKVIEGTTSWTLAVGTYTLTVTATKGNVELTATVEITVNKEAGGTTQPADPIEINISTLFTEGTLAVETYTADVVLGSDDYTKVTVLANANNSVAVDANGKKIDGYEFTHRLKLGGKGSDVARSLKIELAGAAKITVYMMSSSSGDANIRSVGLWTGTFDPAEDAATVATQQVNGDAIAKYEYTVDAAGTYYLAAVSGGTNVYAVIVTPTGGASQPQPTPADPIEVNISTLFTEGTLAVETYTADVVLGSDDYTKVTVLANANNSVAVDANGKKIDGYEFTHRLKLSGKGSDAARSLKIELAGAAKITVYMMSSSSGDANIRSVGLWTGTFDPAEDAATVATQQVNGDAIAKYEYTVDAAGTYYLAAVSGGTNVYAVIVTPTGGASQPQPTPADPIEINISTLFTEGTLAVETYTADVVLGSDDYTKVTVLANANNSVAVDANGKKIDGYEFTHRLKLSGKGSDAARSLKIELAGAAKITVYMMSSSSGDANIRSVGLWTGTFDPAEDAAAVATQQVNGDAIAKYEYTVDAAGTYYLAAVSGGTNVYAVIVTPV